MTMIRYVGPKASKEDNVAHTGIVWMHGTAQDVPEKAVPKLLLHPLVWVLDSPEVEAPATSVATLSDAQLEEKIALMAPAAVLSAQEIAPPAQKRAYNKKSKG